MGKNNFYLVRGVVREDVFISGVHVQTTFGRGWGRQEVATGWLVYDKYPSRKSISFPGEASDAKLTSWSFYPTIVRTSLPKPDHGSDIGNREWGKTGPEFPPPFWVWEC